MARKRRRSKRSYRRVTRRAIHKKSTNRRLSLSNRASPRRASHWEEPKKQETEYRRSRKRVVKSINLNNLARNKRAQEYRQKIREQLLDSESFRKRVQVCKKRSTRKQILFAKSLAGKGKNNFKKSVWNKDSYIKC